MSARPSSKLVTETEGHEENFVLDFLYHDGRRVGSFLSQFEGDGILQQSTHTTKATKNKADKSGYHASGSVGIVSGKTGGETQTSFGKELDQTKVYDPFWSNARALLDHLTERGVIQDEIRDASIGQFVLVKGFLSIQDLAMFKDAWKLKSIQNKVKSGVLDKKKSANMTAVQRAAAKEEQENAEMLLDLLQIMPHSVHARLLTTGNREPSLVWCTLNQEYLISPASDISLTYGANMSGEWSILGIITAYDLLPESSLILM